VRVADRQEHDREQRRNTALARWISVSGASYQQLADVISDLARARKINAAPDSSRVSRWVAGEHPRGQMPDLIAEALTRLCSLTYTLTRADIGLGTQVQHTPRDLPWQAAALAQTVLDVTRNDLVNDHPDSTATLLGGSELLDAVKPWLHRNPTGLPDPTRPGRISLADVEKIRATTAAFRHWDNEHGSGLSRYAVVAQLKYTTELMRHGRMSDTVGRELFSAIGDLASVAGWMTHDAGRSAEGQRYLLLGLRAATEAGDTALAAHLLNCLSRISNHLGHVDDALEMVQLAQYGTRKLPNGRVKAVLAALEARALAIKGDLTGFHHAATAAANGLDAANTDTDPEWVHWFDPAEYYATIGIAHMLAATYQPTLAHRAVTMIQTGIPLRPATRVRSQAFDHIGLARADLVAGDLDAAGHATAAAIQLAGTVDSSRVADRMTELDGALNPYRTDPAAQHIRDRIRAITPK
jgi:hypothetical protein